ncbi:putative membrane-bound metal-dependent hydrolase [Rubellimicrobium thermophilum DSM 16684]|uniref:Putative membrane-bound metal-dependent hydrolase n=1 Tax=Rubellimicrobium thermophilum DSM 16684 TaxID=1123069 RepID=S9QUI5_9RHOB|nr:putative membrane-bound metal-dependent hydrolase [Rubellimicrobium thermophilum DSM 16684]
MGDNPGDWLEIWIRQIGLSAPGQAAIFVILALAFLPMPDIDLLAIRLLHHRSILTHSLLVPFLLWWFMPSLGPAAAAGAFLGVAVHLSADVLSPSRGYGLVWWPEPFQTSLGRWSRLWLLLNAIGGAGWRRRSCRRAQAGGASPWAWVLPLRWAMASGTKDRSWR